jgi:hypothetical protein
MQSGLGCGHVDYAINYLLKTKLVKSGKGDAIIFAK